MRPVRRLCLKQEKKKEKENKTNESLTGLTGLTGLPALPLSLQEWDFEAGRLLHYVLRAAGALGLSHEQQQRDQQRE